MCFTKVYNYTVYNVTYTVIYIYIYNLLIKFDSKKLIHMFHTAFKKSFNLQLVDLKWKYFAKQVIQK